MDVSGSMAARRAEAESIAPLERAAHRRLFIEAARVLTISLAAATLLSMTARVFWLGDLAVHFPLQYAALALMAFLVFVGIRRPAWAALALGIAVANALGAAPALAASAPQEAQALMQGDEPPVRLRMVSINVLYRNREYRQVTDFILRERPDAVALMEISDTWRREIATLGRDYPYRYETRGSSGRGVSLWSRFPLRDAAVLDIGSDYEPAIQATLLVSGRPVRVFVVHAAWPVTPELTTLRNRQLQAVAQYARETRTLPLVVLGDLNISPFSPHFQRMLREGGLRSASAGFGWYPTWPTYMPVAGIQIDHALVSERIRVQAFECGSLEGSDHRPIRVDLAL
jgi:endonuclease/exonuclease/phosphatase (EEP) superfamily protein YafD